MARRVVPRPWRRPQAVRRARAALPLAPRRLHPHREARPAAGRRGADVAARAHPGRERAGRQGRRGQGQGQGEGRAKAAEGRGRPAAKAPKAKKAAGSDEKRRQEGGEARQGQVSQAGRRPSAEQAAGARRWRPSSDRIGRASTVQSGIPGRWDPAARLLQFRRCPVESSLWARAQASPRSTQGASFHEHWTGGQSGRVPRERPSRRALRPRDQGRPRERAQLLHRPHAEHQRRRLVHRDAPPAAHRRSHHAEVPAPGHRGVGRGRDRGALDSRELRPDARRRRDRHGRAVHQPRRPRRPRRSRSSCRTATRSTTTTNDPRALRPRPAACGPPATV